jgi:hypothetical protein
MKSRSPRRRNRCSNYVRMSDGGPARHEGPRSEVEIIARSPTRRSARRALTRLSGASLTHHSHIRQLIARIIPGYEILRTSTRASRSSRSRAAFSRADVRDRHRPRQDARGRTSPTACIERAHSALSTQHSAPPPPPFDDDAVRRPIQHVVYEEEDIYRGQERRDVILMNQIDIDRNGI